MTTIEAISDRCAETPAPTPLEVGVRASASLDTTLFSALEICERQRLQHEEHIGFDVIIESMARHVAPERVTLGIDSYRTVIRANVWLYPTVVGSIGEVPTFLSVWSDVHTGYFALATEIFDRVRSEGTDALVDPALYAAVIASETSRGWVGKRSPIGPDRQIEQRELLIETVLADHLDASEADTLLTLGGLLPTTRVLRSAEQDMTALLTTLTLGAAPGETIVDARMRMLRDYTKYSVHDLDHKLASFVAKPASTSVDPAGAMLDDLLDRLPHSTRATVVGLLADIRALNFVNLNLEPRFSFKSWAGLMHGLVFAAVRDLPGMSDDIYHNLTQLKEMK